MYIYIENNIFINKKNIFLIIDYNDFCFYEKNKEILENRKRQIVDVSDFNEEKNEEKRKRTLIFTNKYIYITSYNNRTLKSRSEEYEKLVNSIVF